MTDFNFHEQVTYFHTLYLIYNEYFSYIMDEINEEDCLFIRGLEIVKVFFLIKFSNRWTTDRTDDLGPYAATWGRSY